MMSSESSTKMPPPVLSDRCSTAVSRSCTFLGAGTKMCRDDPYDAVKNPQGFVNMGTSENYLMQNEILAKLSEPKLQELDHTMLVYNDPTGHPALRQAIAEFLTERGNAPQPLDPNKVVVINGVTASVDVLAFCIGDPKDAFLCPTPYYGSILRDVGVRSEIQLFYVNLTSQTRPGETEPFQLTVERLEESLQQAKDKGVNIRGLFLMNPFNPLGDVYTKEQLHDILLFCKKHYLHVILDEIYLCSVFGEGAEHSSILRYKTEDIPDPMRTHFTWGFSKDFGMSGLRVAMIYTWNKNLKEVLAHLAEFHQIAAPVQHSMRLILQDKDFLNNVYFPTYHHRLRDSHKVVTDKLKELGIPYLDRSAGLFVWANLSKYLTSATSEAEQELYEKFNQNKIYIRPSSGFYGTEVGWFRIVFSREKNVIRVGMERFAQVCQKITEEKKQGQAS